MLILVLYFHSQGSLPRNKDCAWGLVDREDTLVFRGLQHLQQWCRGRLLGSYSQPELCQRQDDFVRSPPLPILSSQQAYVACACPFKESRAPVELTSTIVFCTLFLAPYPGTWLQVTMKTSRLDGMGWWPQRSHGVGTMWWSHPYG